MNPRDEDWARLAAYVRGRRNDQGWPTIKAFAEATGLTAHTLSGVENGRRVRPNTLAIIENALSWKPGSCAAILDGGEPAVIGERADPGPGLRDEVERKLWALDLPEAERWALVALHRGMTDRDDIERRRSEGRPA